MRFFQKCTIIILFFLLFPTAIYALGNWEAYFAQNTEWVVVRNQQHDSPNAPCRGPEGEYTWNFSEQGARMNIEVSVPCSTEAIWKRNDLFVQENFALETTMHFSDTNMDRNLLIRWIDSDNYLLLHFFQNQIFLESKFEGTVSQKAFAQYPFQSDTNHLMRVEYLTRTHAMRLFINNEHVFTYQASMEDPWLSQGYPGVAASVGMAVRQSEVIFRDYRVSELATPGSRLPLVKQNNSLWGSNEYDHASLWSSTPTIARWGCALTSAVMVLHSHGHLHLPDETALTPSSLNLWLLSQPDGYLGQGHLNWRAISRLTSINEQHSTLPALEFSSVTPAQPLTWIRENLNENPIILQVPEHFVVAKEKTVQDEITIHDPFYSKTLLSEYENTFLSARVFTPTHTNLSAILLTSYFPIEPHVFLYGTNIEVPLLKEHLVGIRDPISGEKQPSLFTWEAALEPDQRISLQIEPNFTLQSVNIFGYNQYGNFNTYSLLTPPEISTHITVQFSEESAGPTISVQQYPTFLSEDDLLTLLHQNSIRSPFIIQRYQQYLQSIIQSSSLQEAEAIATWWQTLSSPFQRYEWLTPFAAEMLNTNLSTYLRLQFP